MADEDMDFNMPDQENFDNGLADDDTAAYRPQQEGAEKDITSDGGVKKLLIKAGTGYETPETGDDVSVHYTGTLLDGTKFDSSVDRGQPFTFKLGQKQVIQGWDKGVATMKKGEKALFTITSDYAYGSSGSPPTIPANATLKFEVELLSWTSVKDIFGDGGVIKKILEEGKKWDMPKDLDEVTVRYEARLQDGSVFAKTPEEGLEFVVKEGHLCPAISKTVKTMYKGQKVLLTIKPQYGFGADGRDGSEGQSRVPPNETLTVELEVLSWKDVEDVTSNGKVLKKTLKAGEGYEKPNEGAVVQVRYTGKLQDGTVFERKGVEEGQEFEFTTDEEQTIAGIDLSVMKMKKGEVALVTIAPEYAFGSVETKAELAVVPPGSTVQYEVELVSFVKEKESWDLKDEEKVAAALKGKDAGNVLFKEGKYERASKKYTKALKLVEYDSQLTDELKKQAKALRVTCNLNNAACKLKLKDYSEVVKLTTKVLETETQNVKALYRRIQGYMGNQDYDLAEWDVKKALEIDPQNRDIRAEQRILKQKVAEQNKKEMKLYGNMFARLSKMEEKDVAPPVANGGAEHMEVEGVAAKSPSRAAPSVQ